MKLEPLYRATWTTPEAYHVELAGTTGTESRSFFVAEGRTEGRLSARLRAADYPRQRYRWLNDRVGGICGEVRPRDDGDFEVVVEVSELVWEPVAERPSTRGTVGPVGSVDPGAA